jgi:hypothetical protein
VVGAPFAGHEDCYRYWAAVRWNHNVPELWDATLAAVRRSLHGQPWTLEYGKVVQWQARGAAHIHAVLRTTASGQALREAIGSVRVQRWGWGSQMKIEGLAAAGAETTTRAASAISSRIDYLCRYAIPARPAARRPGCVA